MDPRTPVVVGVAAASQRFDDPADALEPIDLMEQALVGAADDAGTSGLLEAIDEIRVPRGMWRYSDPGRMLADRVGAASCRTQLAEIGILQTSLLNGAARAIAEGRAGVVAVVGGEAKYRSLRASILGVEAPDTDQQGVTPDEVVAPHGDIISRLEIDRGLVMATHHYAFIENALRYAEGLTVARHRQEVAELWARFSEVAVANPDAWDRSPHTADEIREPVGRNRMLAFPYTKLHNSQWNVDQAAAIVVCSAERAEALGIARDRWVFPLAGAESNHMVPVSRRLELHRSPGFAEVGRAVLGAVGVTADEVARLELYSCFPVAVRVQARELGISEDRDLTQTGGMTFAGGPLNNFVLQGAVTMARTLRDSPDDLGLFTAVSGMLTKQGAAVWAGRPAEGTFELHDVTDAAAAASPEVACDDGVSGVGTVVSATVVHDSGVPRAVAVVAVGDERTIASSVDEAVIASFESDECCALPVSVTADATFHPA